MPHFGVDEPEPELPEPDPPEPPEEEPPELAPLEPAPELPDEPLDPPLSLLLGAAGAAGAAASLDGEDVLGDDASPPLFFGDEE